MELIHLSKSASPADVVEAVDEHGYVIIDELASSSQIDAVQEELGPYIENTEFGRYAPEAALTRRTGSVIARSQTARSLIMNEFVLAVCDARLSKDNYQLSLAEVISLWPGSDAQIVHRDELAFGLYPFANDYEVQVSTLWALTDYTEEMGATRVVPKSHRLDTGLHFDVSDTLAAEMPRGSVMIYSGKFYHGSGGNTSDRVRQALNVDYALGWLRQEENQYLSCPPEIAQTLPEDLLRLMGYRHFNSHGRVGDWIDPLSFILGKPEQLGDLQFDLDEHYSNTPGTSDG